jgi:hypothetical protein
MASNVSNPKKMTITIRIVDEATITFKQWYKERTAAYASEAEALKHWEAMCVGTQGLVVVDKDEGEFEDYEEWFWDIEEENKPEEEEVVVAGPPEPLAESDYEVMPPA